MSLPRYPEYKDSGDVWIGQVPESWKMTPIKHLADFVNGCVFKPGSWSESGTPIIRIENLNGSDSFNFFDGEADPRHHISKGDLLFGWSGNRGTSFGPFVWQRDGHYFLNQHIFKISGSTVDNRWFFWCLKAVTAHVEDQATGIIGMVHVTKGDLGAIKAPVPSSKEQNAIATFLDRETAKIDALIAEQEKLLALLAEKRQATISHAVTRGLNPNAPMKDSGIPWLGEVPAHWAIGKIHAFARRESGHTPSRQHPEYWENCTIPWFSLSDVWQIRSGNVKYVYETKELVSELGLANSSARLLPKGTVILSRTASVGYSAIMGCDMATTQDFVNWVCGADLEPEFLLYVLRGMRSEFDRLMMGSTHQTIYMPDIAKLTMGLPPKSEQLAIIDDLDAKLEKLDGLRDTAEHAIDLLKERRSALISAAVTGKIDVRQAA